VKYVRPARYGQKLHVEARLIEYENRLKIGYRIVDTDSGKCLTKGYTVQVAVDAATGELLFVSPPVVFEKLARAGVDAGWHQTPARPVMEHCPH
jgi:acyl-CoA thioester hydrolase